MTGSQKSLGKGSAIPAPLPQGLVRLYSMRFCPYAHRARLFLVAKGIKHEVVNINLKNKPEWIFVKSPSGLVPSLETSDGKIIYESPIVCEYLDEAFPGVKLVPSDPYEKAEQKMLLDTFSGIPPVFLKILVAHEKHEDPAEFQSKFFEILNKLEQALVKKNTPYFGGKSVSYIDYMVWPWFEKFSLFGLQAHVDKTPNIKAWIERMLQDPAVKATYTKPEVFLGFCKLHIQNSLDAADYGLE